MMKPYRIEGGMFAIFLALLACHRVVGDKFCGVEQEDARDSVRAERMVAVTSSDMSLFFLTLAGYFFALTVLATLQHRQRLLFFCPAVLRGRIDLWQLRSERDCS
jgi:hypothetical protein